MSKSTNIESTIAKLAALKLAPRSPEAAKELRIALAHKVDYVVGRAAAFIKEFKLPDFGPELVAAFRRVAATHADQDFDTRTALVSALYEMKGDVPEVYLAGLRMFGSVSAQGVDPAAPLRGICAMALIRINHPRALIEATDLVADTSPTTVPAQIGAVRALALSCEPAAMLVLRLKLRIDESNVDVVCECLAALMQLDAENSLPLVKPYLDSPDEAIAESAALALGESRRRDALDILRKHYARLMDAEARRAVLLAISLTRLPDAAPFLVEQISSADLATAGHALDALRIYRLDDALTEKIREAVQHRGSVGLKSQFEKLFC